MESLARIAFHGKNSATIPKYHYFLVLFDCWLIIYNSNKNTGSITSFFMQSYAFRYISQFDTAEQRKKDDYHASTEDNCPTL